MDIPTQDELVGSIDAFLRRHSEIGEARFGRDATGEPGLVDRLRKGSSPTLKIIHRIVDYMARKDAEAAARHVDDDPDLSEETISPFPTPSIGTIDSAVDGSDEHFAAFAEAQVAA